MSAETNRNEHDFLAYEFRDTAAALAVYAGLQNCQTSEGLR
jgi:hypothetical protein